MRPRATLVLRRLLLGVVAVVAVSVFFTLRRPSAPMESDPSEAAEGTTIEDLAFDVFEEGERKVELKARAMTGVEDGLQRFEGVEVTSPSRPREGPPRRPSPRTSVSTTASASTRASGGTCTW